MTERQLIRKIAKYAKAKEELDALFSAISDEELVAEAIRQGELEDPLMEWQIATDVEYCFLLTTGDNPTVPALCFQAQNLYKARRSVEVKITPELLKRANKR
jgi:hypothetical protein